MSNKLWIDFLNAESVEGPLRNWRWIEEREVVVQPPMVRPGLLAPARNVQHHLEELRSHFSMVASPVAIVPASRSIRSGQRSASEDRDATLITGTIASP